MNFSRDALQSERQKADEKKISLINAENQSCVFIIMKSVFMEQLVHIFQKNYAINEVFIKYYMFNVCFAASMHSY